MTFTNLVPEQKQQLIEFYKAVKMATKMFSKGPVQNAAIQVADQIINELKKEQPDEAKVKSLAEKLQFMANP
jgi:pantothenate synthetase